MQLRKARRVKSAPREVPYILRLSAMNRSNYTSESLPLDQYASKSMRPEYIADHLVEEVSESAVRFGYRNLSSLADITNDDPCIKSAKPRSSLAATKMPLAIDDILARYMYSSRLSTMYLTHMRISPAICSSMPIAYVQAVA